MRLGWKLPLEKLSSSSLGMSIQCPEQFRQKYILGTPDKNFGPRFIGSVNHEMSRSMSLSRKLQPEIVPDIELLYREAWNQTLERDGEPDWRDDDPTQMFDRGVQMSQMYWNNVSSKIDPVAVEERIEFMVPGVPSLIVGYIDLIEQDKIREIKTTDKKMTKPKPKWRLQGLIYQYATGLPVQWDVVTRQATPQLFLGSDWPDLTLGLADRKVTEQLIRDAAFRVNTLYSLYGPDNPWPMEGVMHDWLCDYCPVGPKYLRSCPAWII